MAEMSFITYFCEWFDYDDDIFWFPQFKRLARERFRLMSTDDLDYKALEAICKPHVTDMFDVAKICYHHNETYFREELVTWIDAIRDGGIPKRRGPMFLRGRGKEIDQERTWFGRP